MKDFRKKKHAQRDSRFVYASGRARGEDNHGVATWHRMPPHALSTTPRAHSVWPAGQTCAMDPASQETGHRRGYRRAPSATPQRHHQAVIPRALPGCHGSISCDVVGMQRSVCCGQSRAGRCIRLWSRTSHKVSRPPMCSAAVPNALTTLGMHTKCSSKPAADS
jgi:hypothetical protein